MSQKYNWKRFWCPREGILNLGDAGYLWDPEASWALSQGGVHPFDAISHIPCLVLLGEPGIGKTTAMLDVYERLQTDRHCSTLLLDLRSYGSEDRLVRELFGHSIFLNWVNGYSHLHLFLDSFDECLLRIDTLATLLIDQLRRLPVERLSLRVASRTGLWPTSLEDGLTRSWGQGHLGVYELAPLRRRDVIEAVRAHGLDADQFLADIDRLAAVPLAIKPTTLNFLLNVYRRTGRLLHSQSALYSEGCRLLCEEPNELRRDTHARTRHGCAQRLRVAERIAAVTLFANRYAIWTSFDRGDVPPEDITIRDLSGGQEAVDGAQFAATEQLMEETLATGLFSARGRSRIGWAHHSYSEFLAARYLVDSGISPPQIMSLITHAGDPDGRITPQLHGVAAWLASMVPEVFRRVMRSDPEVLLASDSTTTDANDRAALVQGLLTLYEEGKLIDRGSDLQRRYVNLDHPSLSDQLRPYLIDKSRNVVSRRVAIDIAEACHATSLIDALVIIALDPHDAYGIRVNAAFAVARIGGPQDKAKMKPLALGQAGDDPEDELKGCALQALWPSPDLSAPELFAVLDPPKRRSFIGAYYMFLHDQLPRTLSAADLPYALDWVTHHDQPSHSGSPLASLTSAILDNVWLHLFDLPELLPKYASAALSRIRHYESPLSASSGADSAKRRLVAEYMVESDMLRDPMDLIHPGPPFVTSDDLNWVIQRLSHCPDLATKQKWAKLTGYIFDFRRRDHIDAILDGCLHDSVLAEELSRLVTPVELDSPQAAELRRAHQRHLEATRPTEQLLLQPTPTERIAQLLDSCEAGNVTNWWFLNRVMTLEVNSRVWGDDLEADLTALPWWKTEGPATRSRLIAAANQYLYAADPSTHTWLGTNTFHLPAAGGYRALLLLHKERRDLFEAIPAAVWQKWTPIVLAYPLSSGQAEGSAHAVLVECVYRAAPDESLDTLRTLIRHENETGDNIFVLGRIKHCWDERLAGLLLSIVTSRDLKPPCAGSLLAALLDHEVADAQSFAEGLVRLPIPSEGDNRRWALMSAQILFAHSSTCGWSTVWPAILSDEGFARAVIEHVAHWTHRTRHIEKRLTEEQLAHLYVWLASHYHYSELPDDGEGHYVGPDESAGMWRDSVLSELKSRGTEQACQWIEWVGQQLPHLEWLKWTLLEARSVTWRRTWVPPKPADLMALVRNPNSRLIQSGEQLLDVLVESLCRCEDKLQGETPAAVFLWDQTRRKGEKTYQPKEEAALSNWLRLHLEEDLRQSRVVVNREVEIRRGEGTGVGEITDIHVDTFTRSEGNGRVDRISAIIEVKGCWNPDVNTAMERQLVNRYLRENRCPYGIYVVGWYHCTQWDDTDPRNRSLIGRTPPEAQQLFDSQARRLSKDGMQVRAVVLNAALR